MTLSEILWRPPQPRAALRVVLRPLLSQQVEINRTLSLMNRALAGELAAERLRTRALEQRIARIGSAMRELKGDAEPLDPQTLRIHRKRRAARNTELLHPTGDAEPHGTADPSVKSGSTCHPPVRTLNPL